MLVHTLTTTARLTALAGLILGAAACQGTGGTAGDSEALLGLILMGTGIQHNDPAVAAVGKVMVDYGAAKAGRSETNVNIYGGGNGSNTSIDDIALALRDHRDQQVRDQLRDQQGQGGIGEGVLTERKVIHDNKQSIVDEVFKDSTAAPSGSFYYFAANYWKDFNGDGMSGPNEYVGIKDKFRKYEDLILVSYNLRSGLKGHEIVIEIYSPNGNLIDAQKNAYKEDTSTLVWGHDRLGGGTSLMNYLFEKGGFGNYKVVWKLDGKYDGSTEFEIVP